MRKLRYILKSLVSDNGIGVFLFLEMFILIFTVNLALGEYNSRKMLYDPVEPYISKQGFLMIKALDPVDPLKDVNTAFAEAIGENEIEVLNIRQYTEEDICFYILPDKLYEKLHLPTAEGEFFRKNNNSLRCQLICTKNTHAFTGKKPVGLGEVFILEEGGEAEIAAVLSDPTYIPNLHYELGMSYEEMYLTYESAYYNGQAVLFTSEREFSKLSVEKKHLAAGSYSVLSFKNTVPEEEYESIKDKFKELGYDFIENKDINARSQKILSDDFKRFVPAVFVFGLITLIGIFSCSMIGTRTMMKKLAVFYCFGATKLDCAHIAVGRMTVVILISGISAAIALSLFRTAKLSVLVGFIFGANNVTVTLVMIAGTVILSALAPMIMISKSDPRQLLTDTANE